MIRLVSLISVILFKLASAQRNPVNVGNVNHIVYNARANVSPGNAFAVNMRSVGFSNSVKNAALTNANVARNGVSSGYVAPGNGATNSMSNIGNVAIGNKAATLYVAKGNPLANKGSPEIGLRILADGLKVGGMVAVTGKLPLYGVVTANGQVPGQGRATVSYRR